MTFSCRHCNISLVVPDELTGQYMICPICSGGNDIPDPPPTPFTGYARDYGVAELKCLHCNYNLEGLTENRCPECGRRFTPTWLAKLQMQSDEQLQGFWGVVVLMVLIAGVVSCFMLGGLMTWINAG